MERGRRRTKVQTVLIEKGRDRDESQGQLKKHLWKWTDGRSNGWCPPRQGPSGAKEPQVLLLSLLASVISLLSSLSVGGRGVTSVLSDTLLSASDTLSYLVLTVAPLRRPCAFPVLQKLGSRDEIHNTETAQHVGSLNLCGDRGGSGGSWSREG